MIVPYHLIGISLTFNLLENIKMMARQKKFVIQQLAYPVDAAGVVEATRVSTKVVTTAIRAVGDVIEAWINKQD